MTDARSGLGLDQGKGRLAIDSASVGKQKLTPPIPQSATEGDRVRSSPAGSAAAVSRRILCVIVCGSPRARGRSVQGQAKTILLLLTIAACRRRHRTGHRSLGAMVGGEWRLRPSAN